MIFFFETASLVDSTGRILIPGIYDDVAPITEDEKKLYENIDFDLEEHKNNTEVNTFLYSSKVKNFCYLLLSPQPIWELLHTFIIVLIPIIYFKLPHLLREPVDIGFLDFCNF